MHTISKIKALFLFAVAIMAGAIFPVSGAEAEVLTLAQKQVDVINAFTTDAQLAVADVKVLKDDLHVFKNYYCGTVVRQATLDAHPELMDVLNQMSGILTDQEMAKLNYELEVNGKDERELAVSFLQEKGLLPEDYHAAG